MVINELLKTFLNKLQVLLLILKLKSYNFLEVCITIFINPCFLISNLLTFYCVTYNLGKVIIKNIIRSRSNRDKLLLNNCVAYKEGVIEVQDEASQLAAILADVRPEHKIIDYCCGAGGKSLTMAFLMNRQGKIQIHDINRSRLEAVKERAVRLDVKNLEIIEEVGDRDYDRFVVDAPCSGTGTWRRSPDAKYRLTPETLKELNKTQAELLEKAFNHIRRGGRVVYITCSILRDENEDIIEAFLSRHADAAPVNLRHLWEDKLDGRYPGQDDFMLRMNPLLTRTDGFFVCILEKR